MRPLAIVVLIAILLGATVPVWAESAACTQARAIVAEVERMHASGAPDHALILSKLTTARNLCSTLGEAWKYAACSAAALGQERDARIFSERALFNGIVSLDCATGERPAQVPPRRELGYVHDKHALVIGISQFRDPLIPRLRFAAKDARDLAAVLADPRHGRFPPENVTLLTDEHATRANILNALQDLYLKAREDDLVFLYVSSHGSPRRAGAGLGGVGYVVTYDTALDSIWVDALDYEGFSRRTSLIEARRKVVFLDTCYSGQASRPGEKTLLVEGVGIDPRTAELFLSGEGTYVVTSSKAAEKSFESETIQNSYFTYYLIEALKRGEEPPTLEQVFAFLSREVPTAVARDKRMPQHPQILPADGLADIRIGVVPLSRAEDLATGPPP